MTSMERMPIWTVYDHPADYPDTYVARLFWTVYDHPADYPDTYVARLWYSEPTDEVLTAQTLEELRTAIAKHTPWLIRVPRLRNDDPKIVEVWI